MSTSLSSLVDTLSEINFKKCKRCKEKRKIKSECDFIGIKNKLNYKCKECKKFPNIHKLCNGDINKFVLLLRKGVYPYEYMDNWDRFDETSLPDKKIFLQRILS